jgi:hypothetical protein
MTTKAVSKREEFFLIILKFVDDLIRRDFIKCFEFGLKIFSSAPLNGSKHPSTFHL